MNKEELKQLFKKNESSSTNLDYSILFEKLEESIATQESHITENLMLSQDTLNTISYFRDFQEAIKTPKHTYFTKSR